MTSMPAVHLAKPRREHLLVYEVRHVPRRPSNIIQHANVPLGAEYAHPVNDVALCPRPHRIPALVPVRPNILLACHRAVREYLRDDLVFGTKVDFPRPWNEFIRRGYKRSRRQVRHG